MSGTSPRFGDDGGPDIPELRAPWTDEELLARPLPSMQRIIDRNRDDPRFHALVKSVQTISDTAAEQHGLSVHDVLRAAVRVEEIAQDAAALRARIFERALDRIASWGDTGRYVLGDSLAQVVRMAKADAASQVLRPERRDDPAAWLTVDDEALLNDGLLTMEAAIRLHQMTGENEGRTDPAGRDGTARLQAIDALLRKRGVR